MTAIASLAMYDLPEIRDANDTLWQGVAARLRALGEPDVPDALDHALSAHEAWAHPDLLLGQSCGYPATTQYRDALRIVATPRYAAPGCAEGRHCSFIIVQAASPARRLADLRGSRFAMNGRNSNSGMNLPRLSVARIAAGAPFFAEIIESGSHAGSLAQVAEGTADAASIDCVTHALLARHRPELVAKTRILEETAPSPALPYVTARGGDDRRVARLRDALASAFADPDLADARAALLLSGVAPADATDYTVVLDYEGEARRLGYPTLA